MTTHERRQCLFLATLAIVLFSLTSAITISAIQNAARDVPGAVSIDHHGATRQQGSTGRERAALTIR